MGEGSFFPEGEGGTTTTTQQAPGTPTTSDSSPGTPTRTQVSGGTPTAADASFTPPTPSQAQDIHVESGTIIDGNPPILRLIFTNGMEIDIPVAGLVGPRGPMGLQGDPGMSVTGPAGRGIQSLTANTPSLGEATTLDVTFTDGSTEMFIIAAGATGARGERGEAGTPGMDGDPGLDGQQGNSITGVSGTKSGETVTLDIAIANTGTQQVMFNVPDGTQGDPGVSVSSGAVNASGQLVLTLSNGSTINVGNVVGPQGQQGDASTVPGPAGRGIDSISREQVGNTVTLTFLYTDGSTEAETFSTIASIPQDMIDLTFVPNNRDLTLSIDGVSDTVNIPPATGFVNLEYNEASQRLSITVDDVADTITLPLSTAAGDVNAFLAYADTYTPATPGSIPTSGGFLLDTLGEVVGRSDVAVWPAGAAMVEGVSGITYVPGTGSIGTLTNNTGADIDLSNGRLDVDVTISSVDTSLTRLDISFRTATEGFLIRETSPSTMTMTLTDLTGVGVWNVGEPFSVFMTPRGGGITLSIDALRLSFTQTEFQITQPTMESVTGFSLTPQDTSRFFGIAVGPGRPMISTGGRGYVWTEYGRSGGAGQGFTLVNSLSSTAPMGAHERLNSDGRGYFRGLNVWTQADGQQSSRLTGDFRLENTNGFTPVQPPSWDQHPTYFIIGEFNDN